MKATFVYTQPRRKIAEQVAAGAVPDSLLLGQNHLREFGIESAIHDPLLDRRQWPRRVDRLNSYLRELMLPLELPRTDAVVTALATLYPLANRLRYRPVFTLNMGLCNTLARWPPHRRRVQIASLRSTAAVVCFSEPNRERLLAQTGLSPDRVKTALLGVDQTYFSARRSEPEDFILVVGFDLARDYATFMEAMRDLPYRAVVVARSRSLAGIPIPGNVDVFLDAPFPELRELYARAKCMVISVRHPDYPYGGDTSGVTSLLEGMAMAKPIIVSERPDFHDYVVDGESARFVPAEDPHALTEVIRETMEDRSLREALGEAALETARANHTTRHFAERLAAIIHAHDRSSRRALPG